MKIYEYENYEAYVAAQTEANKRKIGLVWVKESTIKNIFNRQPNAKTILCHGTRNGAEQRYFRKYFKNSKIIGTEISDNAKNFKDTVQHDFHEPRSDWVNVFDIVYSNAWDHSYNPKKSLVTWSNQLSSEGILYLEFADAPGFNRVKLSDPLEISVEEMLELASSINLLLLDTFIVNNRKNSPKVYIFKRT